jgi:hypothetical protein
MFPFFQCQHCQIRKRKNSVKKKKKNNTQTKREREKEREGEKSRREEPAVDDNGRRSLTVLCIHGVQDIAKFRNGGREPLIGPCHVLEMCHIDGGALLDRLNSSNALLRTTNETREKKNKKTTEREEKTFLLTIVSDLRMSWEV